MEDRMLLEFRDVLSGSKEEANRTDEVVLLIMDTHRSLDIIWKCRDRMQKFH